MDDPLAAIVYGVGLAVILILLKVPIAVSLGTAGITGMWVKFGWETMFESFKMFPYMKVASWELLPVPLFILMGFFAAAGGVTSAAFKTGNIWLGRLPGGLAHATNVACAMFAAACGSSTASAGAMGAVAIPEMLKYGYDKRLATGVVCVAGTLGVMIPPSIIFVIYGICTGTSISKLLIAGILPGILTMMVYSVAIGIIAIRYPERAPRGERSNWSEKIKSLKDIWGILALAACVMGGIYSGILTATESAGVGAFVALLIAIRTGMKGLMRVKTALIDTACTTSMIFLLFIGSSFFSFFLTMSGSAQWVGEAVLGLPFPKWGILATILLIYVPLGMIIDSISMILITMPIVFPIVQKLGFDPVWFGVLQVLLNEIAVVTPPMGINLYVTKGVSPPEVTLEDVLKGMLPFLVCQFIVLVILTIFPQISLFLPSLMK